MTAELVNIASNPVPEGARAGYFLTSDKVRLRYAIWPKPTGGGHEGTICLVQGRAEFIEKYFETIADFRARGFAVATFDWRGQGGSDRLIGNKELGYVDRFEDYWTDLQKLSRRDPAARLPGAVLPGGPFDGRAGVAVCGGP